MFKASGPNFCLQEIRTLEKRSQGMPRRDHQMRPLPWAPHKSQCWGWPKGAGGRHGQSQGQVIEDTHDHLQWGFSLVGTQAVLPADRNRGKTFLQQRDHTPKSGQCCRLLVTLSELLLTTALSACVTSPPRHTDPQRRPGKRSWCVPARGTPEEPHQTTRPSCVFCVTVPFLKGLSRSQCYFLLSSDMLRLYTLFSKNI